MKKIVVLFGMFILMGGFVMAQEIKEEPTMGPEIKFEKLVHDYGEVPLNGNGTCEFTFTNVGNEPLILERPKSSCGCTVPTWPKEPILPGESEIIKVTYNTKRAGVINKTVTVVSNSVKNNSVVLRIKGKVVQAPEEALPTKPQAGTPVNK